VVLICIIGSSARACFNEYGEDNDGFNPDNDKCRIVDYVFDEGDKGISFPEGLGELGAWEDVTGLIFDGFDRRYGKYLPDDTVWIENCIRNSGEFNPVRVWDSGEGRRDRGFERHGDFHFDWSFNGDQRGWFAGHWRDCDWDHDDGNIQTPEPTTAMILGIGGLFITLRRRHN
jgi:hypothetical protein